MRENLRNVLLDSDSVKELRDFLKLEAEIIALEELRNSSIEQAKLILDSIEVVNRVINVIVTNTKKENSK